MYVCMHVHTDVYTHIIDCPRATICTHTHVCAFLMEVCCTHPHKYFHFVHVDIPPAICTRKVPYWLRIFYEFSDLSPYGRHYLFVRYIRNTQFLNMYVHTTVFVCIHDCFYMYQCIFRWRILDALNGLKICGLIFLGP